MYTFLNRIKTINCPKIIECFFFGFINVIFLMGYNTGGYTDRVIEAISIDYIISCKCYIEMLLKYVLTQSK